MSAKRNVFSSFKYAFRGFNDAFKGEPNLIIHSVAAVFAVGLAYILKFSAIEWAIVFLTLTFVFTMELINTVLEEIVNIVSPQKRERARIAKDVAASFVLLSSISAIAVGLVLYLPKILLYWFS